MQPKIWFDATTVIKLRGHLPVGLSRLEANALRSAMELLEDRVRYCCFNRYEKRQVEVPRSVVQSLLDSYGNLGNNPRREATHGARSRSKGWLKGLARQAEKYSRITGRRLAGSLRQSICHRSKNRPFAIGDTLVVSGASWDSIDADTLKELVDRYQIRLVTTIADMIPILYPHHFQNQQTVESFRRYAAVSASHASLVVSISKSTKADFERFAKNEIAFPQSSTFTTRSELIYLGSDSVDPQPTSQSDWSTGLPTDLRSRRFVLCVGTVQIRKNHQLLYQLWRRFAEEGRKDIPVLVLVGARGWLADDVQYQIRNDPALKNSVVMLDHTDDRQLAGLYQNCDFTLYPSIYEGWGLPIVESLQYGKPCIASNTSSMPEASQNLALHLDPLDFQAWYHAILKWVDDRSLLCDQSHKIQRLFQHRSWSQFGKDFCDRILDLDKSPAMRLVA